MTSTAPAPCLTAPGILQHHLDELRRSGLSDETIATAGIRSETNPVEVRRLLGMRRNCRGIAPAIVFPNFDPTGKPNGYCRVKPDDPRKGRDGKPIKYESPAGLPNRLYIPPPTIPALSDSTAAILITEGEKKTLKAIQEGYHCIGIPGVYAWKSKGREWSIPDFDAVQWSGRRVYIAFDSDAATNPNVKTAQKRLASHLQKRGATVLIVTLPEGQDGAKVGLDDYLVAFGVAEFSKLIELAREPDKEESEETEKIPAAGLDPMHTIRRFLADCCTHREGREDLCRLLHHRGEFFFWQAVDGLYRRLSPDVVRAQLVRYLDPFVCKITSGAVSNLLHAAMCQTIILDSVEPPSWLSGDATLSPADFLATKSGLVHLPSFLSGAEKFLFPHTPRLFNVNGLDFPFDLQAPRPAEFLSFLDSLWRNDLQSIESLQEWLGYLLTSDTRQQKMLVMVGPRRSGKGTIARIIRGLVGSDNVAGPTLAGLGTNFGLWPLIGKTVAIISDARLSGRTDSVVVTERLLSISGEDALTIDRKCIPPVTAKLSTRFVILTNELPRLGDSSGALVGRMIVLKLTESFFGREDQGLTERLISELPGILLWALDGLKRLRTRGYFAQPESGRELVGEMEDLSSPIGAFLTDCCIVDSCAEVERPKLYAAWRSWCSRHGKPETDEATFGRDLRAAVPGLGSVQRRDFGVRVRCHTGVALIDQQA